MPPLDGILVVAVEQAVAAPLCTSRLREAGARVIKIERAGGDFARNYDDVAGGDSSYFLWLNRGKESLVLDFKDAADAALLRRILGRADVLVQNLAPGALERSGFASEQLRREHPRLITCDISGYGDNPSVAHMKAYDLLVQAESGLVSISGGGLEPGRIGVSICDIGAGMNAHAGVLEALLRRERTGRGSGVSISLFGAAADWMSVPLLHQDYGAGAPGRAGLHHPSIAPYGGYDTRDQHTIIVAVQNEREWARFRDQVLGDPAPAKDGRFESNNARVANRPALDEIIGRVFAGRDRDDLVHALQAADIAYGAVNGVAELSAHHALKRREGVSSTGRPVRFPARPIVHPPCNGDDEADGYQHRVPAVDEHGAAIREEFSG